jgi:uncharacterized protein with HEPN domain
MRVDDRIRLQHMLDAAQEVISFTERRVREDLSKDRMLVLSVLKDLEIIGEAAGKVTAETRENLSDIPWADIIGMRNHLIHGYFEVDYNLVWDTIRSDIPFLISQVSKALE